MNIPTQNMFTPTHMVAETGRTYLTADTHFGHDRIRTLATRPFIDSPHQTGELISKWNSVVPPNGVVYHLGDFAFCGAKNIEEIVGKLNGKIHLILGNHDMKFVEIERLITALEGRVYNAVELYAPAYNGRLYLSHMPHLSWDHSYLPGHYNCHGHLHLKRNESPKSADKDAIERLTAKHLDVGIDNFDYKPISIDAVYQALHNQETLGRAAYLGENSNIKSNR
jgi:calcineurin-like phosphoesterase family protein